MAQPGPAVPPSDLDERTAASAPGPAPPADTMARDGARPPTVGFAQHVVAVGVATILAGLFLAVAPFLLDYVSDTAAINAIVCGALAMFLGALRFAGVRHPAVGYTQVAVGIWLVVASVLFGELPREAWIARSIGVMLFFLGLLGLARMERDPAV